MEDLNYTEEQQIEVLGARVHNLQNIDVCIPRNQLTVITGLSGSGKSSLAFDTIYAEGQRRYIETFSAYARQFLGNLERPDVDQISGLSPVISIEQKTTNKNPRSTVGTITEIYDFLRLLYARVGVAYSYLTQEAMVRYTDEQILNLIMETYTGQAIYLLAPLVKGRKGHYQELFDSIRKKGFLTVRVNEELIEIKPGMKLDRYKTHHIEMVVDKLLVNEDVKRLKSSIATAMKHGNGILMLLEKESGKVRYYSRSLMCPTTGISYNEPAPHSFSFNSPAGACPVCNGLGFVSEIDIDKIIPDDRLSIRNGGIALLKKYKPSLIFWQLEAILEKHKTTLETPIRDLPEEVMSIILYGSDESFKLKNTPLGTSSNYFLRFDGIINYLMNYENQEGDTDKNSGVYAYMKTVTCKTCQGQRLKQESLHFKVHDKNIAELSNLDISDLSQWFMQVHQHLTPTQLKIATEILKEINTRISFLMDVGLDYLALNRSSRSLSGGESQRIRLATQIGSQLVNVLYILDEPSIGLHQKDNHKLIQSLKQLRDTGNSIIVVEHDEDMIRAADHVIDMGPMAGKHGGKVVAQGKIEDILSSSSLTAQYLNHTRKIEVPASRRSGSGKSLVLHGAKGNNLKNLTVEFPLGKLICVTGVSGSGKSTLINETLHPIIAAQLYRSLQEPLPFDKLDGIEHIDKIIEVDQAPLGRTPRSNPATYTKIFDEVRKLYEILPESKIRGYKAGRFSFNVKGGRCETCKGAGVKTIEMNFLPDVLVHCDECNGRRYNRETLEVRYKGKSISDVLDMTIEDAYTFFESIPNLRNKLKILNEVGVGYLTLGQPSTTLSGGESQRIKLSAELAKRDTGKTLYILDEPTTGLHFEDVRVLMEVVNKLVDRGNTMIIIEHNLDVIKLADYVIDMGKEGGKRGGEILCTGTPEEIAKQPGSYTGLFLQDKV
ncbi:MAG: excinuclease ABC subunit UvrA [Bacteroidales bacterium]|nr:excinuclease ABC subunit UvrA [Bacteroidales bacterium]